MLNARVNKSTKVVHGSSQVGLDPTRTRPAGIGGGTRNQLLEKSIESVSGEGERQSSWVDYQNKKGIKI